jgi:hypothetical protein
MLLELAGSFGDTFHQDGRCVYADDRVSISLIHGTGTAPGGDRFDNLAVYVGRLRPDGTTERLWTVDLDAGWLRQNWTSARMEVSRGPGVEAKNIRWSGALPQRPRLPTLQEPQIESREH